jgi:soluble lytic murein transglycosylase-like protein
MTILLLNTPKPIPTREELRVVIASRAREEAKVVQQASKPLNERDIINGYVRVISAKYNINPELVMSIIQHESEYIPTAKTGDCLGLMQVSTRWHSSKAKVLGVTNFYDSYSNILLGVDYLSELFAQYKDPALVLMLYNMNHDDALALYAQGKTTQYARSVLSLAEVYQKGE